MFLILRSEMNVYAVYASPFHLNLRVLLYEYLKKGGLCRFHSYHSL